jgi:polyisoprenoid-binding protein YceI
MRGEQRSRGLSRKIFFKELGLAAAALSYSLAMPAFATELYKLDPLHTAVVWHVSHLGFSTPSGKFMNIDGALALDRQNLAASKVNVTIPIALMDTGVPKLDEHLKSKDFFDAATYPTATFVSNTVDVTSKDTAIVHGTLTLHGVSKAVDLEVRINKLGEDYNKVPTAGFSATATIKRSDFGITFFLPMLPDEIRLEIETEANSASAPTHK